MTCQIEIKGLKSQRNPIKILYGSNVIWTIAINEKLSSQQSTTPWIKANLDHDDIIKSKKMHKNKGEDTWWAISTADSTRSSGAWYSSTWSPKSSWSSSGTGEAFKSTATIILQQQATFARQSAIQITCNYLHTVVPIILLPAPPLKQQPWY